MVLTEQAESVTPKEKATSPSEAPLPSERSVFAGATFADFASLLALLVITFVSYPFDEYNSPVWKVVWFYGWLTAISTGVGTLPFYYLRSIGSWWLGTSNALAAGMMLSASYSLINEGLTSSKEIVLTPSSNPAAYSFQQTLPFYLRENIAPVRVIFGLVVGVTFTLLLTKILHAFDDLNFSGLRGASAKKVLLIVLVMGFHSLSEGIGIGVSFGGLDGISLGKVISTTLAVHNVPEGLAVALVLIPQSISPLRTTLLAIATSLPQPLIAIPAFYFVTRFLPLLPFGLGFAAGAMCFVALTELLVDAVNEAGWFTTTAVTGIAAAWMWYMQEGIAEM